MEHFSSHLQSWTLSTMKGFQTEPSKSVSDWLVQGAWKPSWVVEHFSGYQNEYFSIWNKTICFISSNFGLRWFLEVSGVESWIISSHSILSWDWVNPSDDILSYSGMDLPVGPLTTVKRIPTFDPTANWMINRRITKFFQILKKLTVALSYWVTRSGFFNFTWLYHCSLYWFPKIGGFISVGAPSFWRTNPYPVEYRFSSS